jgi:hypothetical protein
MEVTKWLKPSCAGVVAAACTQGKHTQHGNWKGFLRLSVDTDTYIEVSKDELENIALESTRTIDIDEFVPKADIDPRYLIRPYYLVPDGKVGHDAFAVIRETKRALLASRLPRRARSRARLPSARRKCCCRSKVSAAQRKKQPSPSGQPDDVKQDSESRITPASPRRDCKM